jgi:hypothetical protein
LKIKKKILLLVLLIFVCYSQKTLSQDINVLKGIEVKPYIFNLRDLPDIGDIYIGPEIKRNFNEVEPPYSPPYPIPDVKNLSHFTYDKSADNPPPFAPNTGVNFEGIAYTNSIPSEPQPAVGSNHIFILGNVSVKIADKSGTTLSSVLQTAFFNIPSAEGAGFDAKCFYDYRRGRFLALCETNYYSSSAGRYINYYYLAISATSDAMGTWYIYKFDMTKNGATQTSNWSDFPGLGISDDKLVMSGQQYNTSGNYQYQKLRVIDRALAYSGSSLSYGDFVSWSGNQFVTKPGRNMSSGNDIYLLATKYNGGTTVEFRKITGTPASPVLSTATNITVSAYGASLSSVPGGSSANTVNTGDCRTPDFFVRNNVLNIAFHMGANIGGSVTAIRFLRIQVNPMSLLTDETYGAAGTYYYYPMVCMDSVGSMFMGFGRSSVSDYPSSYVTGKRRNDASIQSSVLAKSGSAVYSPPFGGYYRWGDYTGIDMDESATNPGGSFAWYVGQYTKTATIFGTWISQLSFTYGQIAGQVLNDADGDITTTGDRTPVQGVTVTLKQGAATLNTLLTDASGNYNFGYLETASNYSLVFTPPAGKHSVDVIPGSGGTSQTKTDYKTIAVNLTNSQTSVSNNYIISDWLVSISTGNWNNTAVWSDNVTPSSTEKVLVNSAHTVTINNNYSCQNINDKGILQFDNVSPRTLTISGSLDLANGNITLGNNTIITGSVTGASSSRYIVTNGTGQLKQSIPNNNTYVFFPVGPSGGIYNPVNIKLDIASTTDVFGLRVSNTITTPPFAQTQDIQKEWNITEGIAGGSNATIQYSFGAVDFGSGFNPNLIPNLYDVGHFKSTGSYEVFGGTISGPTAGLYTITNTTFITSFSPFIVGNYNSVTGTLPVELASFTANVFTRDVKLNWTTATEINNSGFEIERSNVKGETSNEWVKLAFVTGNGTKNTPTNYSFDDKKLNTGKYNYRLKQIDYNGNFEYFDLKSEVNIGVPNKYDLSQNYPNPFNPVTKIDFDLPFDSKVSIRFYDITGREIKTLVNDTKQAGYYTVEFNGNNMASGIYFYRIEAEGSGQKFVMTKKALLIK